MNSAVVSATETARLGVGARGAQSGIGKVHPMLDTHSNQIALAAGMRPVVIHKRGQRLRRRLGASAFNGEFCSRAAHRLRISAACETFDTVQSVAA